jgi:3-hydroxyisobutyrate dehydrogenase
VIDAPEVDPRTLRAGFIGLGSQGGPMARRIVEAGHPTTLWSRRPETLDAYRGTAAEFAGSPAELGARADVVGVCVRDDAGVEEVVTGPHGLLAGMAAGSVVAVHSTVHPETCRRLADQAAERGVALIDAPVSGGGPAAGAGRLLVMAGGDAEALERCRPVFSTYADTIVHLGPVGAGLRAKLINNTMFTAHLGVLENAYTLARALDVDPVQLTTVLRHGSGQSHAVNVLRGPEFVLRAMGAMAGPLLQKDVRLLVALAGGAGAEVPTLLDAADAALESMGSAR